MTLPGVLLLDDHPLVTDGLKLALEKSGLFEVVAVCRTAQEGLDALNTLFLLPRIALVDYRLPGPVNGLDFGIEVRNRYPQMAVVLMSSSNLEAYYPEMKAVGIMGCLNKLSDAKRFAATLSMVMESKQYFAVDENDQALTPSEIVILKLIWKGMSSSQIATQLSRSKDTIDTHRRNMVKKLGLKSNNALLKYAVKQFGG